MIVQNNVLRYQILAFMVHKFTYNFNIDFQNFGQHVASLLGSIPVLTWSFPVDTGRKLNVHKTFRRGPGRLLNVLCTFNLRPVSSGFLDMFQLSEALDEAVQCDYLDKLQQIADYIAFFKDLSNIVQLKSIQ